MFEGAADGVAGYSRPTTVGYSATSPVMASTVGGTPTPGVLRNRRRALASRLILSRRRSVPTIYSSRRRNPGHRRASQRIPLGRIRSFRACCALAVAGSVRTPKKAKATHRVMILPPCGQGGLRRQLADKA